MVKHPIDIAIRIPGTWTDVEELAQAIPNEYQFTGKSLVMPDGSEFVVSVRPKDSMFVEVFGDTCKLSPTSQELRTLRNYRSQVCLVGSGGSMEQATRVMRAAVPILKAGGAGVFVDNSVLAFGAKLWCDMAEVCNTDALTFGFVSIVNGKQECYTVGLHVLGQPDLSMPVECVGDEGVVMIEMIFKAADHGQSIADGQVVLVSSGKSFCAQRLLDTKSPEHLPMYNPWGRIHLTPELQPGELKGSISRRNAFRRKMLRGM